MTLTAASCGQRTVEAIAPPPDRMDCEQFDQAQRPTLPAGYVIDWSQIVTVDQARGEHEAYVERVVERNERVSGYIVELEGRLFACSNDAAWLRAFFDRIPTPE